TAIEASADGCKVRRGGKLVSLPLGSRTRRIDFGCGERLHVATPWGDVSTEYYTTGIPTIDVLRATSPNKLKRVQRLKWLRPMLRRRFVQQMMKRRIEAKLRPSDQTQRESNPSFVWGEVRNEEGRVRTARLRTPNGYALTVQSALGIMERLLAEPQRAGF